MSEQALVIGGTGFLGATIVNTLRHAGWETVSLARGQRENPIEGVPLLIADRTRPGELAAAIQGREFQIVVDCAAFQEAEMEAAIETFSGRVRHYIFISTDFVYASTPDARFPVAEDAPKQWDLPYGAGKLACEAALLRAWEEKRFPYTALRPPHILGAGRPLGCDPLTMRDPRLLARIRAQEELPLLAEGQMLIQPVWNREIASCIAHLAACSDPEIIYGQVFNIAGLDGITTRRYYGIIAEYLGTPLRFRSVPLEEFVDRSPEKAHMARHRLYDLSRLNQRSGYQPHLRVEDAIRETAQWLDGQDAGNTRI